MEGRVRTKQFRLRMQDKEEPYGAHGYIGGTCFLLQIKQAAFDPRVFQNPSRDACFGVIDSIHELFDQADAGHGGQFPNPEDLASIAVERKCGRLEWRLDWNSPSVDFYLSLGGGANVGLGRVSHCRRYTWEVCRIRFIDLSTKYRRLTVDRYCRLRSTALFVLILIRKLFARAKHQIKFCERPLTTGRSSTIM